MGIFVWLIDERNVEAYLGSISVYACWAGLSPTEGSWGLVLQEEDC